MQAVSTAHFWRLGVQVLSSKAPAGQAIALDTELFAIRLGVAKATSFDVKHIILITDSLSAARRAVDTSVHSGQAHSLSVVHALREFFTQHPDTSINFWDCPSKAQWSLHHLVHEDVTQLLHSMLFVPRAPLPASMPGGSPSVILHPKVATSYPSKAVTTNLSSPPIPKVAVGFPLLLSQSHCVPGRLELSSTMLPLESSDSAFSLQSALSVCVAIARWKHVDTS